MSATAFQRIRREALKNKKVEKQQNDNEQDRLESMSVEELMEYAKTNNIDTGNASSQKGILKKIKEAENSITKE